MKKVTTMMMLLAFTFLINNVLWAQNKTIKGTVTDASNQPLGGVSVKVKEVPGIGVSTNAQGQYTLSIPEKAKTLVFSIVGYRSQTIAISRLASTIILEEDAAQLDEMIVVGYGTKSKKDLTGSVSGVKSKDIENLPLPTVETALQGRASGVFINSGSGKLGQGINIRVRGISSVSAATQPLFVIDGQPIISTRLGSNTEPDNPLASIAPDDIESMEVLKDAAATSIYGARGANGVVIITTKSGKVGKTKVDFNYYTGISTPTRKRKWLNAAQYRELFGAASVNGGFADGAEGWDDGVGTDEWNNSTADVDWADQAFQRGGISNYGLNISGGDAKTRFLISSSYNEQKGIIIYNELNRSNLRANIDHSVTDKFKVGMNVNLNRLQNGRVASDNSFTNPLQLNALPPIQPVRNADGSYNRNTLYLNVLNDLSMSKNSATSFRTLGNFFAQYDILSNLFARTEVGMDMIQYEEDQYNGRNTTDGSPGGDGFASMNRVLSYNTNNTINWSPKIGTDHNLELMAGMSFQKSRSYGVNVNGRGFPNDNFQKIASAAVIASGASFADPNRYSFLSYFSRASYKFKNRYILGASLRYDASSRFGKDNRYGMFPSVSGAWILSEEEFLKNDEVLSFLKVKASYGSTGNAEIGNFASRSLYGASPYADQSGIIPTQIGVNNLSWEKTNQLDVGVSVGLIKDRILFDFDFYKKQTNGLLLDFQLPGTNGFSTITQNLGTLSNTGFDFNLTTNNFINEFKWTTTFNISAYKNKITNLNGTTLNGGSRQVGRVSEGEPFGYFYGPKYAGVNPENGNAQYINAEGNAVDQDDFDGWEQKIGDPNPDFYGGIGNRFTYKGFDLDIQTQYVLGGDLYNIAGFFQSVNGDYFDNQSVDQMNYWKQPGDITNIPKPVLYGGNGAIKSSRWVQDGSYFRVKNVVLGYNFSKTLASKLHLSNLRIYVAAQNLFTFTKYEGYDPEVNASYTGSINLGHDFYTPPQAKTVTMGINFGF